MKKLLSLFVFLLIGSAAFAQFKIGVGSGSKQGGVEINYNEPKEYEIAEITVSGSKFYDGNSMLNIANLRTGDKIMIPGGAITGAVKKLMDQGILEDVELSIAKAEGSKVWLNLKLKERPRLYRVVYNGIKKGEEESLNEKIKTYKGKLITETLIKNTKLAIEKFYQEKGFLNIGIKTTQVVDSNRGNNAILKFFINKKKKVKIDSIIFVGLKQLKPLELYSKLKDTKARSSSGLFASCKFVPKKFEADKGKLLDYFNKKGYRDARIVGDSIIKQADGNISLVLKIDEGNQYRYRNITWEGNFIYPDSILADVLGIKKGDVFDPEDLEKRMSGNPGNDVSTLYMDDGYLFYNADPQEIAVPGDSIDLVVRIHEGKQATINKIIVNGNTKTSDHVVLREIRTLPGQKFNKSAVIRTVRELATLGYFNPEKISPQPTPRPDGTVDIEYNVEEKPSDQIELSGGWGGFIGFVGTLGVVFNNFSIKNVGNLKAWRPLPAGDGQKLAIRFQANGTQFQNYSLSFTEPWLGGKKPTSFSVSLNHNVYNTIGTNTYNEYLKRQGSAGGFNQFGFGGLGGGGFGGFGGGGFGNQFGGGGFNQFGFGLVYDSADTTNGRFNTTSLTFSIGKRLKWPDDFFTLSVSLSAQIYDIKTTTGVGGNAFSIYPEGKSFNMPLSVALSRNSIDNPQFPRSGSSFTLSGTFTPPYSMFERDLTKFKLEYYKIMFDGAWNTPLIGKFVLHTRAHFGFLGRYTSQKEFVPIERFILGGSGLTTGVFNFGGVELIGLRGYADRSITPTDGRNGLAYNKYVMELRYPVSLNPSATIYALGFMEAGNNFGRYEDYNPFKLYRSAGIGVRIFMPAFGMLGFDFGKGFDPIPNLSNQGLSSFTFTIGQQIR
jgi:outer membrane protein insertion porin family